MLASALGVRVGTRVQSIKPPNWRRDKEMVKIYEVVDWRTSNGYILNLRGRTVRKNGTLGEIFEIDGWEHMRQHNEPHHRSTRVPGPALVRH